MFGRGGEEAEVLASAGIAFELVPGVTSALAGPAYAGIPVTHRDWVSGVTVLTGHEAKEKSSPRVDWQKVATAGNTLVLLMGLTQLRHNLAKLLAAGLAGETPAAAIRWASRPRQRVIDGTVASLAELVELRGIRPPVTIVIGEVVRLRERLAWFERRPLFGHRIVVTRTRAQAGRFREILVEQGAEVVECPVIEIRPLDEAQPSLARAFEAITARAVGEEDEAEDGRRRLSSWLATHPDTDQRIARARAKASAPGPMPLSAKTWAHIRKACVRSPA